MPSVSMPKTFTCLNLRLVGVEYLADALLQLLTDQDADVVVVPGDAALRFPADDVVGLLGEAQTRREAQVGVLQAYGDRHQLPAVGRGRGDHLPHGGVLDTALTYSIPMSPICSR